jgi:hypothetical protein
MKRMIPLALALAIAPVLPAQDGASVTLFNSGRTLVRQNLPVRLPAGTSTQPLAIGVFDPSSFTVLEPGVSVERLSFDAAFNEDALLRRNIGQMFTFDMGDGKAWTARLLGVDPERWQITGGGPVGPNAVIFGRPGRLMWGVEQVPTAPVADVTLTSDRARQSVRVMYEAMGGAWHAGYRLFIGANGRFEGTATIQAGTFNLENAEVQLLAGDIGQKAVPAPALMRAARNQAFEDASMTTGATSAESIGEVRLYTVPGRVTFVPGAITALPLFAPTAVRSELRLTVPGAVSYWGGIDQFPDEHEVPVQVSHRFERRLGTPFGDLPLPAGGVSVYETDRSGRVQLVGQGNIGHTAAGEMLEVSTGTAFDVTARRTQTAFSTTILANPRRTVATVEYSVVVKNAKDTAAAVEVREDRGGEWSVVTSSVPPVRRSSSRVVFPITVPAKGEVTLTYRLRVVW